MAVGSNLAETTAGDEKRGWPLRLPACLGFRARRATGNVRSGLPSVQPRSDNAHLSTCSGRDFDAHDFEAATALATDSRGCDAAARSPAPPLAKRRRLIRAGRADRRGQTPLSINQSYR